jgi:periplasmic protein CpxP/Spy
MNPLSQRFLRGRPFVYAAVLALAAAGGVSALAFAHGGGDAQAMSLDANANPADLADHVAHMSEHIYAKVGATDAQKAQLDPIFAQAASDLAALHAQFGSGHDQALELLAQNTIDRAALESMRVEHMRFADEASKRMTQLLADIAEALTPAQRRLLVDGIKEHHAGHMGMGFHGG